MLEAVSQNGRELDARQADVIRAVLRDATEAENQTAVALKLKTTQSHLSKILRGEREPGAVIARAMVDAGYLSEAIWGDSPELALVSDPRLQPVSVEPAALERLEALAREMLELVAQVRRARATPGPPGQRLFAKR